VQEISAGVLDGGQATAAAVSPTAGSPAAVPPIAGRRHGFAFHGTGGAFFVLILKNLLLTLVTLGLYAPWAKTERRKFMWQNIEFHGQRLMYHGTGAELFVGYVKVIVGYLFFFGLPALVRHYAPMPGVVLQLVLTLGFIALIPYAVYWSRAYLLSRTTWRGVRFSLDPQGATPFAKVFVGGYFLTLLTLGLYGPIWLNRVYKAAMDRTRFGTLSFRYDGEDKVVWGIMMRGFFLTLLTLGIYYFWYSAEITRYRMSHTHFSNARGESQLTGGTLFEVGLVYFFGTTLTLGIAFPWVVCYMLKTLLEKLSLEGEIDFARIAQGAAVGNAAGDGLADAMDVGLSL
jgi:uncharacterized membrane protein YjgN (DUF898 family)